MEMQNVHIVDRYGHRYEHKNNRVTIHVIKNNLANNPCIKHQYKLYAFHYYTHFCGRCLKNILKRLKKSKNCKQFEIPYKLKYLYKIQKQTSNMLRHSYDWKR